MDLVLPILGSSQPAQTCVWMDAGALAYRLCDRGYACEHCPFDAAMRHDPRAVFIEGPREGTEAPHPHVAEWAFPPDRLYAEGHCWLQVVRGGHVRAGVDAFAARLLSPVRHVTPPRVGDLLQRGEPLCMFAIAGGELPLRTPVTGRVICWNAGLDQSPALVATEPYAGGWLVELTVEHPPDLDSLLTADAARSRAELDARRLRRDVAFHLLSDDRVGEPGVEEGFVEAAVRLLGPDPLVEVARQFLHERGC
ncbi:MAG: hypothetical protein IT436_07240 [Phycisphaerales bacterium]|nr:hypothetical protein [Phycisphaerales bacterium]